MPIASMPSLKNKGDIRLSQVPVRHNSNYSIFSSRVCCSNRPTRLTPSRFQPLDRVGALETRSLDEV